MSDFIAGLFVASIFWGFVLWISRQCVETTMYVAARQAEGDVYEAFRKGEIAGIDWAAKRMRES